MQMWLFTIQFVGATSTKLVFVNRTMTYRCFTISSCVSLQEATHVVHHDLKRIPFVPSDLLASRPERIGIPIDTD